MEAFYNQKKHQYVFVANRCGTNFLASDAIKNLGYSKQNFLLPMEQVKFDSDALAIFVIRDPYERWKSWFDIFFLNTYQIVWNKKNTTEWIEKFELDVNNDYHTEHQSLIYTRKNLVFKNVKYINMIDLNLFFETDAQQHQIFQKERFEKLPLEIQNIFEYRIKKIYQADYEWIEKLPVVVF